MELWPEDTYQVESLGFLSEDKLETLYLLYQPILKHQTIGLYMSCYAGRKMGKFPSRLELLATRLDLSMDQLSKSIVDLQVYKLLEVFVREDDNKKRYVFALRPPLNKQEFIKVKPYFAAFIQAVGEDNVTNILSHMGYGTTLNLNGYRNVTLNSDAMVTSTTLNHEVVLPDLKPVQSYFANNDIHFDYDAFLAKTSPLVFPVALRNEENLSLIGELATVHGLSPDTMRLIVKDCVNIKDNTFNTEKLKQRCLVRDPDIKSAKDPYALPPKSFLQSKQHGKKVSAADAMILTNLQQENHFSSEVINIMIEYILNTSNNRLVPKFVDMVAGEWARDNVVSREDAFEEIEKAKKKQTYQKQYGNHQEPVLPQYYKKVYEENNVEDAIQTVDTDEEKLRKQIEEWNHRLKGDM